tara:strand:- start:301 stop:834 length:534 start_codon:yes stop_codon:yes gene_type:complete
MKKNNIGIFIHTFLDRFLILTTVCLIGFAIGLLVKYTYSETAKQPISWKMKPIVVNCIGEEIKEETIIRAIDFWEKHGEEVYFYQYERSEKICSSSEAFEGLIVLRKSNDLEPGVLAIARNYSDISTVYYTEILFKPGTYNFILLLEHELGHSFGYKHKRIQGNVMHPNYDFMGDRF